MRCTLLAICLFLLAPALAGASSLKLAYIKHGWLYTLRIDRAGLPVSGAKPVRIRPVPANSAALALVGQKLSLIGSPDGRYVAVSVFTSVQVISLASHRVVRWPDPVDQPSFSPDGKKVAFDTGNDDHSDVSILDIATRRERILRKNAYDPFWSANGKEIACLEDLTEESGDGYGLILNARTGKVDFRTQTGINPEDLILSPNARYLAILNHLSRPLMGHSIADRWPCRRPGDISDDADEAPNWSAEPVLDAWSPNSKWLLWDWRFTDPDNDGMWLWQDIGLTSLSGRTKRKIGQGLDACFSPDGRHIYWLEPKRKEDWVKPPYNLMWSPLRSHPRLIVTGVDAYTLVGAYNTSRWQ